MTNPTISGGARGEYEEIEGRLEALSFSSNSSLAPQGRAAPISSALPIVLAEAEARSPLRLQAFCLARRFALSAPMAEAIAPLVYGSWRS